jgi:hypothetical protein
VGVNGGDEDGVIAQAVDEGVDFALEHRYFAGVESQAADVGGR